MSFTVAVYALLFALRGLPLDEIVLGIPPGCDAMKSFCTVVLNSSAWCLLISATATWPVIMLYRWLDDNVSGWEYFCSSVHILWRSDTSSCLPFDPFPLCFFFVRSVSPCQNMDTYYNTYYTQGNQWAESKLGRRQPTQQLDQHLARCYWDRQYLYPVRYRFALQIGLLIQTCWYQCVDSMFLDFAYLGEMRWYTWYTSCDQLRRDGEKTIKCHSTMDTDYMFWCQMAILDIW